LTGAHRRLPFSTGSEAHPCVEGNRAGGAKVIMFSNPTNTSGTFYEAFHGQRNFWHPIHISAEESPNVIGGQILIPGLATAEWVEEKRLDWGEGSPLYQVRDPSVVDAFLKI
jgi:phage terminase large subunit